jgi:phosphatidyl-myo-inositol alpha-mannosyltransferase
MAIALLLVVALVGFAVSRLNLAGVGKALITASPGWVALSLALMALSLLLRAASWHETLRAALPETEIRWMPVIRATMIGVMGSAIFPGRVGEPTRIVVLARRLPDPTARAVPVVAGTVFSQTIINLLALGVLTAVALSSVPLLHDHASALEGVLAAPLLIVLVVLLGPALLRLAQRSRRARVRRGADLLAGLLRLARRGLVVFTRPRHGVAAVAAQLLAWALQWAACYAAILALDLQAQATLVAAAAVLLAVNLSAILPATPSNVGVFQAACLVVLAAYGVGAGPALAYGILLQAIEVFTALALGIPALLGEGMTWRDIRRPPTDETTRGAL